MRRLALVFLAVLATLSPADARMPNAATAFRAALPTGRVAVSLECAFKIGSGAGSALAAIVVVAERSSIVETSFYAPITWNHAGARPSVGLRNYGIDGPDVQVTTTRETVHIVLSLQWGGEHRNWVSHMNAGCGASGATITSASGQSAGKTVPAVPADYLAMRADDFNAVSVGAGMGTTTVVAGSAVVDGMVMGMLEAAEGALSVTAPDGEHRESSGLDPWIPLDGRGVWELGAAWARLGTSDLLVRAIRL